MTNVNELFSIFKSYVCMMHRVCIIRRHDVMQERGNFWK